MTIPAVRHEIDFDALLEGKSDRDIRAMLTDILQGDASAQGTLEGLQEQLAIRTQEAKAAAKEAAQAAAELRRYPWSQYRGAEHCCKISSYDEFRAERSAWHEARLYRVTWFVPDSSPGMYGWRSVSALFRTEEEALAVAKAPMGIARSVALHVSNNGWKGYAPDAKVTQIYSRKNSTLAKRR